MPLIHRDLSCLVVIDVQDKFVAKLPAAEREPLLERIAWLVDVARALAIPIVATTEGEGPSLIDVPARDKRVFGLYGQDDLRAAIDATGRREHVLVGLETDVCIAHSAIGLIDAGYRVCVIEDACGSPAPHHERGLRRIAAAGAVITDAKGIDYEWCRDVATDDRLRELEISAEPGLDDDWGDLR